MISVGRKLLVLVTVPLAAAILASGTAMWVVAGQAVQAHQARLLVSTAARAGKVAAALQAERVAAVDVLASGSSRQLSAYLERIAVTDTAATAMQAARRRMSTVPTGAGGLLDRIDAQERVLTSLRTQVQAREGIALSSVAVQYRIAIGALLDFREATAQAGVPAELADQIRAAAALSRAAEDVGEQQIAVLRALAVGEVTPASVQEITAARTAYADDTETFTGLAGVRWTAWVDQALAGSDILTGRQLEDVVARTAAGRRPPVDRALWIRVTGARLARLHLVEQRIDDEVIAAVATRRDRQVVWAVSGSAGVLLLAAVVILLALVIGRPMVRRLRLMARQAQIVAAGHLPAAVRELERPDSLSHVSPERFADDAAAASMPDLGSDEIGQLSRDYRAVFRAAVLAAAQQVVAHRQQLEREERLHGELREREVGSHENQRTMFVNLARRSMALTTRAQMMLTDAQREEADSARLAWLFGLDHLVTQLYNNQLGLLILGGQTTALVRDTDERLITVMQAALSRIEHYRRIEIRGVDDSIVIDRKSVDLLVYLFGALLENATQYSPPDTQVKVIAGVYGDRVTAHIADVGIGIPAERLSEINEVLTRPRPLGAQDVSTMGLIVVAHIAQKVGARVELRPGLDAGTVAVVDLPRHLFSVVAVSPAEPMGRPAVAAEPAPVTRAASIEPDAAVDLPVPRQLRRAVPAHAAAALSAASLADNPILAQTAAALQLTGRPTATPSPYPATQELPLIGRGDHGGTTANGLPRRRPAASLPPPPTPAAPTPAQVVDPAVIAASMAAFAHGTALPTSPPDPQGARP